MVVGRGPDSIGGRLSFIAEVTREKDNALGKKLMNGEGSPDWTPVCQPTCTGGTGTEKPSYCHILLGLLCH